MLLYSELLRLCDVPRNGTFCKIMKMSLIELEEWSFEVSAASYWPKLMKSVYLICISIVISTQCNF